MFKKLARWYNSPVVDGKSHPSVYNSSDFWHWLYMLNHSTQSFKCNVFQYSVQQQVVQEFGSLIIKNTNSVANCIWHWSTTCAKQHVRHMQCSRTFHCLVILALFRRCELVSDIVFVQSVTPNKENCLEMSWGVLNHLNWHQIPARFLLIKSDGRTARSIFLRFLDTLSCCDESKAMETRQDVCQCLCIAVHLLITSTSLFEAADKKTALTGWVILAIAWLVSRFVASPLVRFQLTGSRACYKELSACIPPRCAHAELSPRRNLRSNMVWDLCLQRQTRTT